MEVFYPSPTASPMGFAPVQRPELTVFYVLDTSGSMAGKPIDTLNRAMYSTVDALNQVAADNSNARVKIAVMEFNTKCRWVQPKGPEYLEDFVWDNLSADGYTNVGLALDELNSKLSRKEWLASSSGCYLPVIIFMTDGSATDEYVPALKEIMQNDWFAKATRIGFAIGKRPDTHMIAKLVGDAERVIRTDDLGVFAAMLRFVSISSVTISSRPAGRDANNLGRDIIDDAARGANLPPEVFAPGFEYHGAGNPFQTKQVW